MTPEQSEWIGPGAAALLLGVIDTRTVRRIALRGEIAGMRLPSGHWRYSEASVKRYVARMRTAQLDEERESA